MNACVEVDAEEFDVITSIEEHDGELKIATMRIRIPSSWIIRELVPANS